jgi:hypothetical protein
MRRCIAGEFKNPSEPELRRRERTAGRRSASRRSRGLGRGLMLGSRGPAALSDGAGTAGRRSASRRSRGLRRRADARVARTRGAGPRQAPRRSAGRGQRFGTGPSVPSCAPGPARPRRPSASRRGTVWRTGSWGRRTVVGPAAGRSAWAPRRRRDGGRSPVRVGPRRCRRAPGRRVAGPRRDVREGFAAGLMLGSRGPAALGPDRPAARAPSPPVGFASRDRQADRELGPVVGAEAVGPRGHRGAVGRRQDGRSPVRVGPRRCRTAPGRRVAGPRRDAREGFAAGLMLGSRGPAALGPDRPAARAPSPPVGFAS